MIIERREAETLKKLPAWTLLYGRRKTGKTFLVQHFLPVEEYFFVKRDRTILSKEETLSYETFLALLKRDLQEGKTIAIDEFHRLSEDFFDFLHATEKKGKLILISSTLFLSKKIFSAHSPLLGKFAEFVLPIISLYDALRAARKTRVSGKELLELAIVLREPLSLSFLTEKKSREILGQVLLFTRKTVPALVGEIFSEEEKTITALYEGVLRATAQGKVVSGEISSYLFSRKLLPKDDPSAIQQQLAVLVHLGLLKKIPVWNKNKFVYKHVSPLTKLFYFADEKYNISERNISEIEVQEIIARVLPSLVEDNVRELLAEKFGLIEAIGEGSDFEVDACLLKFQALETVVEVKWKEKINTEDILKVQKNLAQFHSKKKILFVQEKKQVAKFKEMLKSIVVMDVQDL